jgi:hypothetical protein
MLIASANDGKHRSNVVFGVTTKSIDPNPIIM